MKTYFRLLPFARPLGNYVTPYLLLTLVATITGIFNITLLMPLLDVMFSNGDQITSIERPDSFTISTAKDWIRMYGLNYIRDYGKLSALIFICLIFLGTSLVSNICRYFKNPRYFSNENNNEPQGKFV
jgi:subfamily B ATP-binding cassette protein MsbA